MDEWDWHRTLDVNLTGAFLMTQSVGRMMQEKGQGVIINIISQTDHDRDSLHAAFSASMAGLESFSQDIADELLTFGIHVHTVKNNTSIDKILDLCRSLP